MEVAEARRSPTTGVVDHVRAGLARYPTAVLLVMLGVFAGGVVLRLWVLDSPLGDVDIDEATMALQAHAFLDGRPEVFFPRQAYGGTAETALVAAAFQVLGDSWLVLKLVPLALHLAATVVVWRTACRLSDTALGQLTAPTLLWLGSAYGTWESTKARGFYGVTFLVAAVALLLVVRLHDRARPVDAAALGLTLGIGLWTTPLLAAATAPAVFWLAARRPGLWRLVPVATAGFVVGALPSIVWNLRNDLGSLEERGTFGTTWFERFTDWFDRLATVTGSATPFDSSRQLVPTFLVVVLLAAITVAATWTTRRSAPGLIAVCVLGYGVLQAFNGMAVAVGPDPRYLYPMLPMLALATGLAIQDVGRRSSRAPTLELAALAVGCMALTTWGLVGLRDVAEVESPNPFLASPGLDQVIDELEARGIDVVTTDVAGHQLTYLSGGRIAAGTSLVPRFADLEVRAAEEGRCTYVLRRDASPEIDQLRAHLDGQGIGYELEAIGVFDLVFLDEPVDPADVPFIIYAGPVQPVPGAVPQTHC